MIETLVGPQEAVGKCGSCHQQTVRNGVCLACGARQNEDDNIVKLFLETMPARGVCSSAPLNRLLCPRCRVFIGSAQVTCSSCGTRGVPQKQ